MPPDKTGTPRTARAASWLQRRLFGVALVVAILHGWSDGWFVAIFGAAFALKVLEWAVNDEHRTRIESGATTDEWAKRYRGH